MRCFVVNGTIPSIYFSTLFFRSLSSILQQCLDCQPRLLSQCICQTFSSEQFQWNASKVFEQGGTQVRTRHWWNFPQFEFCLCPAQSQPIVVLNEWIWGLCPVQISFSDETSTAWIINWTQKWWWWPLIWMFWVFWLSATWWPPMCAWKPVSMVFLAGHVYLSWPAHTLHSWWGGRGIVRPLHVENS